MTSPSTPAYADYSNMVTQRAFDPDMAKHYLQKSGVTSAEIQVPNFGEGAVRPIRTRLHLDSEAALYAAPRPRHSARAADLFSLKISRRESVRP